MQALPIDDEVNNLGNLGFLIHHDCEENRSGRWSTPGLHRYETGYNSIRQMLSFRIFQYPAKWLPIFKKSGETKF